MQHSELILVLDFGSQYTQLIARRVRELGVYSEIHPFNLSIEKIRKLKPKGIVLSGGPSSVYAPDAPHSSQELFSLGIPILGICYGLQMIAYQLGGQVDTSARHEYGFAEVLIDNTSDLFAGLNGPMKEGRMTIPVWMSHGDALTKLPRGFEPIAHTNNSPICAIRNVEKKIYGVQFHPEVVHTVQGKEILRNFVFTICGCRGEWNAGSIIDEKVEEIRTAVGSNNVICALSGGVDSSVLAVLLHKAIDDRLFCIHINNGLMRKDESEKVVRLYRDSYHFNLDHVDASDLFLDRLKDIIDPEQKRKIIGKAFIDIFEQEAKKMSTVKFLAQGTLYPDVIESASSKGPSHTIKTHHNVGGLPEKMNFKLIEPFRELFKDEVRAVGRELGLPEEFITRHPFPGPGLAVRIMSDITKEKLRIVREADEIFTEEIRKAGLYESLWQAFAVLLPVQTVGVMGDQRTYDNVVALRAVRSLDGMTADWAQLPHELLARTSSRIVNEVRGVNRVVYDISSKPPSTIEWE
ncbi:MAG: glutamine-hydrolyzing GMP synthase [Ignavibacteriae bacterium]|nr:glutamine-hydrolyzing GMP synthase [Ignavibacteria bacterium]MBI3365475.1 glutamine-hydrolyzing GMP synthase [Ignavibacteriota bacterium]